MRNKPPAWSIRMFSRSVLMLLVLSGCLVSCSSKEPAVSAEIWYRGYQALDVQTVMGLTCSAKLSEAQLLLQKNSETLNQFASHSFDISRVTFRTVDQRNESAIVEVTGRESISLNQQIFASDLQKDWQFVRESGIWKWCGELPYQRRNSFSDVPFGIILVGGLFVVILILIVLSLRTRNYSEFFTQSEKGVLPQIQEYQAGTIRNFSQEQGYGYVYNDRGKPYSVDYGSFIGEEHQDLTNGERVLFQAEWTPRGQRARNVIRVDYQPRSSNPHSRKLVILAERVKKLRQDFRVYKVALLQRELDTCKSFFELLDLDVRRYHIRLEEYEVVLLYEVEKDLRELSDEIQSMSDDSRWWVRILHVILDILNAVADVIERASPQTAGLLRSLGRSAGRLLESKKQPLLGPGKKDKRDDD